MSQRLLLPTLVILPRCQFAEGRGDKNRHTFCYQFLKKNRTALRPITDPVTCFHKRENGNEHGTGTVRWLGWRRLVPTGGALRPLGRLRLQQLVYYLGRCPAHHGRMPALRRVLNQDGPTGRHPFPQEFVPEELTMRALCGAIITAGALIGLGLLSIGMGARYSGVPYDETKQYWVKFSHRDTPLQFALVILILGTLIGLGIAFVGLAFHHERRHRERLRDHASHQPESPGLPAKM